MLSKLAITNQRLDRERETIMTNYLVHKYFKEICNRVIVIKCCKIDSDEFYQFTTEVALLIRKVHNLTNWRDATIYKIIKKLI